MMEQPRQPFFLWRHLNKLRLVTLSLVFIVLIIIPIFHVYQTFVAAHAYDLLAPSEKRLYDVAEFVTSPFTNEPAEDLDAVKGNTWSGKFWGLQLSDPLAVVSQIAASLSFYWPFILTALIPVILTILLGRFFCGWLCPAILIYELNSNFSAWLKLASLKLPNFQFDRRLKYGVLATGLILTSLVGSLLIATIYPPAIIGRELYFVIALDGFGIGVVIFIGTLLFDLLVARRGFCRYVCPGGALYSLLGRYRFLRIRRIAESCNDCAKCNAVCEFGLDPMKDDFGQECNNCTACMAICPTEAMTFTLRPTDYPAQGPGHLGRQRKRENNFEIREAAE